MRIKDLVTEAHAAAKEKGWWEEPRSPLEIYALIHSEISEAVEEARKGTSIPPMYQECPIWTSTFSLGGNFYQPITDSHHGDSKPEGELIELADAVIRIADYCGRMDWDLEQAIELKMAFNKTRSHRHGGKRF